MLVSLEAFRGDPIRTRLPSPQHGQRRGQGCPAFRHELRNTEEIYTRDNRLSQRRLDWSR